MKSLQVGMIGVNADRGWAREAHVPAVNSVDGLELAAVATRRQSSADAAAQAFGVAKAFGDPEALISDPDIDLVVVASSVATHHALLENALRHGKHVMTEWPVAVGTDAMSQIAAEVAAAGVRSATGLQARRSSAVLRAAELISSGAIGDVLILRAFSTTAAFGPTVDASTEPLEKPDAGMHLATIQAAHTLDLIAALGGTPTSLSALQTIRYPLLHNEAGDTVRRTLPDHVAVHGTLNTGSAFVAEILGGRDAGDTPFHLTIEGTAGVLELTGGSPRGFQAGVLSVMLNGVLQPLPRLDVADPVVNVAGVYQALLDDIRNGSSAAPSFADAVRLAHLLDDVRRSDATGSTVTPSASWPSSLSAGEDSTWSADSTGS